MIDKAELKRLKKGDAGDFQSNQKVNSYLGILQLLYNSWKTDDCLPVRVCSHLCKCASQHL